MAALPTFISTAEAAHQLGIGEARLRRMIGTGSIKAANISGETVVSEASIRKFHKQQPISQPSGNQKEDLPEYKRYAYLRDGMISIAEAARKYDITFSALQRWVTRGYVIRKGQEKNKILLNEQDVAYCAEIYHSHRGRGNWLFNADGTPYVPRSEKVQIPA
jgi:predicted site-specific integrase-resolvase